VIQKIRVSEKFMLISSKGGRDAGKFFAHARGTSGGLCLPGGSLRETLGQRTGNVALGQGGEEAGR